MWWWCSFSAAESSVELLSEVDHLAKQVSEGNITLDQALSSDSIWALKTASTEWRQSLQQHRTAQLNQVTRPLPADDGEATTYPS